MPLASLARDKEFADLDAGEAQGAARGRMMQTAVKPGPPPKEKAIGFARWSPDRRRSNPAYVKLKGLIINLYYNSEIATTKNWISNMSRANSSPR